MHVPMFPAPEGEKLVLESLNRAYEPYEISVGGVLETRKFHTYFPKMCIKGFQRAAHFADYGHDFEAINRN